MARQRRAIFLFKLKEEFMNKIIKRLLLPVIFTCFISGLKYPQQTLSSQEFYKNDFGKMWTFENPPLNYFRTEYEFEPTNEWFDEVRKAALNFSNFCSASFISQDGLIMTNHHCVRSHIAKIDNALRDGFYARQLSDEIKIPEFFVDQMIIVKDITDSIIPSETLILPLTEKQNRIKKAITEIEKDYKEKYPDLSFRIISLYNGGKYSLYGYKRYRDIRLVFVPDLRTAKLGGDYDNFTYPRYGLDCAFLRAYENDKPIKSSNYFKWSAKGPVAGEPIFVVGNPGSTERLYTVAQLEFLRDHQFPPIVEALSINYKILEEAAASSQMDDYRLIARLYSAGNSLKVYDGMLRSLRSELLLSRKKAFENNFKHRVFSDKTLNKKYGFIWENIETSREEAAVLYKKIVAYNAAWRLGSDYFIIADKLLGIADKKRDSENDLDEKKKLEIDREIENIFPDDFDLHIQKKKLSVQLKTILSNLKEDQEFILEIFGSLDAAHALNISLEKTIIRDKESIMTAARKSYKEIYAIDDPFVKFLYLTRDCLKELRKKYSALNETESDLNQSLGLALFEVYGEEIPPDATGTLRISDGVMKSYEYNGTIAPEFTTFFGVLDRYYSFNKKFPFNLPSIWEDLPKEFELRTPLNFISTADIVGGNSGSPVINKNKEIVGLAFDGNFESLAGYFIFLEENNRTISVHSEGIKEAVKDLYKAGGLIYEILNGKLPTNE